MAVSSLCPAVERRDTAGVLALRAARAGAPKRRLRRYAATPDVGAQRFAQRSLSAWRSCGVSCRAVARCIAVGNTALRARARTLRTFPHTRCEESSRRHRCMLAQPTLTERKPRPPSRSRESRLGLRCVRSVIGFANQAYAGPYLAQASVAQLAYSWADAVAINGRHLGHIHHRSTRQACLALPQSNVARELRVFELRRDCDHDNCGECGAIEPVVLKHHRGSPSRGCRAWSIRERYPNEVPLTNYHSVPSSRLALPRCRTEARSCSSSAAKTSSTFLEMAAFRSR